MQNHYANVIGLDVGHSAVKSVYETLTGEKKELLFPSLTIPAIHLSDDAEVKRALKDTVTVNGIDYFVGETAEVQGSRALGDVSENWLDSPGYKALVAAALKKIEISSGTKPSMIVAGLPTSLYKAQRDQLRSIMSEVAGNNVTIKIIPQALGAFQYHFLDEEGRQQPNRSITKESWGIIEVGYFSTDFMVMRGVNGETRWIQNGSGICSGVHVAANRLAQILTNEIRVNGKQPTISVRDAEKALITGKIKFFGNIDVADQVRKSLMTLLDEIDRASTRYLETEASSLDGILLAGGGASLIHNAIKDRWPHVFFANNPRYAVAEGFFRYGKALQRASLAIAS